MITKTLKYFARELWRYPWLVIGAFLSYGLGQLASAVLTPIYYKRIVDLITAGGVDFFDEIIQSFIIIAILRIFYGVVYRLGDYTFHKSHIYVLKNIKDSVLEFIQKKSYRFFANTFSGGIVAKEKRLTNSFSSLYHISLFRFCMPLISLCGILVVLFLESIFLGGLYMTVFAIYLALTQVLLKKRVPLDLAYAKEESKTTALFSDVIKNIFLVKSFARDSYEKSTYQYQTREKRKREFIAEMFHNKIRAVQAFLLLGLELGSIGLVLFLWREGTVSPGTIILVQAYNITLFVSMWMLGNALADFMRGVTDAHEMIELIEEPADVTDRDNPVPLAVAEGAILFDNVSFTYKDGQRVFDKFTLDVPSGQSVGLVGPSGAGKTTVTHLLLRFADVSGGTITIDGQDISAVAQDDLRSVISYVPQEPLLFHRTIFENIAYAKPDASREEVMQAAQNAHADEFIQELSDGYDTLVGERGIKLSGGQRQRIAIARAMLKDAPILVLDEATSSLDSVSEKYIQEAFLELMKNRTTLVIAHRLSTIQSLDRIVVIEKGAILQDGSHSELIAIDGPYRTLWEHQHDGFIGGSDSNNQKDTE